jgi:hypothetical protein
VEAAAWAEQSQSQSAVSIQHLALATATSMTDPLGTFSAPAQV